jgi:hypothetical protein
LFGEEKCIIITTEQLENEIRNPGWGWRFLCEAKLQKFEMKELSLMGLGACWKMQGVTCK